MNKKFDSVKFQRERRKRLSRKLSKMSSEEIVAYFKSNPPVPSKKSSGKKLITD